MTELCSVADLRTTYSQPHEIALKKELSYIDRHARDFIGRSPLP